MNGIKYILIILVTCIMVISGCSGSNNPVIPGQDLLSLNEASSIPNSQPGVIGLFNVVLDSKTLTGEMIPYRESLSQDVLEVIDITNFLINLPCSDCAKIHSVYLDVDSNLVVDIGIKHPFKAGDPANPPSAKNRLDLHLFNIEGIVAIESGSSVEFTSLETVIDSKRLLNASGYTGYLDSSLDSIFPTTAEIHPYILHFKDYGEGNFDPQNPNGFTDLLNPSGYHVMPMGSDEDIRSYVFNLGENEILEFTFAIGATYGLSTESAAERLTPVYCLPQFNKKAASEISVEILENNLIPENTSSSALIGLKVLDMNYDAEVGDALDQVRAESKVSTLSVAIPGVGQIIKWNPEPTGGDPKDPLNPLTFEIEVFNRSGGVEGIYPALVKLVDAYPTGLNETPILNGYDGVSRVETGQNTLTGLFNIGHFVTWQYFEIEIDANDPPIADLAASQLVIENDESVDLFPGPGTMDPDGIIVLYEYDFDWDGITFDVDASNTTGAPVTTPIYTNYTSDPLAHTFATRVTDDGIPVLTDTAKLTIVILPYSTLGWARTWGGSFSDLGLAVAVNDDDGVYAAGCFRDTVDFNPDTDLTEERIALGDGDAFLVKYDFDGNFLWVQTWGGDDDSPDGDRVYAIAIDDFGNIFVTGTFFGLTDFDPGTGIEEHQAGDFGDIFISQFNTDGTFNTVRTLGGNGVDIAQGIEIDDSGNIIITGCFESIVDFNPSAGTDLHTASGWLDAFIIKFDSALNYSWGHNWGTFFDRAFSVALDSSDSIYVTGFFMDTVDFDPGVGVDEFTSNGEGDVFLVKFNSSGAYQWAATWGSPGTLYWQRDIGNAVSVDSFDNVFVGGSFYGTTDFDPDVDVDEYTAGGTSDAFISKFTSDGTYQWALTLGNDSDELYHGDSAIGITIDSLDNLLITGGFYGTVDFDPGAATYEYTSNGSVDAFICKFDNEGNFQWARTWGASGFDDGLCIGMDMFNTAFIVGHFNGNVNFNPGMGSDRHRSNGYLDVFLYKLTYEGNWL